MTPAPPTNKNATQSGGIFVCSAGGNQTRGTRGEQGFRIVYDEPVNDSAHAGALAGDLKRLGVLTPSKLGDTPCGCRVVLFN